MNVIRCRDCKHWLEQPYDSRMPPGYGKCILISLSRDRRLAARGPQLGDPLYTLPVFGCVLGEKPPENS